MENVDNSSAGFVQQRGIDASDRFSGARDNSKIGAIEYFLTKLKRVDAEISTTNAELRELNEEISIKELETAKLKIRLENLMREETNREIKRLKRMEGELKENIRKADRVLAGLGLIWVGENAAANSDPGVRFIANPDGSFYRPDHGYHEITKEPPTVAPFSGHGYRLGTGSEILEQGTKDSDDKTSEPPQTQKYLSTGSTSASERWSPTNSQRTTSEHRIRHAADKDPLKIKSLEELPLEFRLMTRSEKRRALKQVSVQIQKNMNKYAT